MDPNALEALKLAYGYLDDISLAEACVLNSQTAEKICNSRFWIDKIQSKYHFPLKDIDLYKGDNTYWAYYVFLYKNTQDFDANKIIRRGAIINREDLVRIGLNRGADEKSKQTALHYAIEKNNLNIVKYIVELGYDIPIIGLTVKVLAIRGYEDILAYLNEKGLTTSIRFYLSDYNDFPEGVRIYNLLSKYNLLEHDVQLDLGLALNRAQLEQVKFLLEHGAVMTDRYYELAQNDPEMMEMIQNISQ